MFFLNRAVVDCAFCFYFASDLKTLSFLLLLALLLLLGKVGLRLHVTSCLIVSRNVSERLRSLFSAFPISLTPR